MVLVMNIFLTNLQIIRAPLVKSMYHVSTTCNDSGSELNTVMTGTGVAWTVGLNQKLYLIKAMTCGMGLHLVYYK